MHGTRCGGGWARCTSPCPHLRWLLALGCGPDLSLTSVLSLGPQGLGLPVTPTVTAVIVTVCPPSPRGPPPTTPKGALGTVQFSSVTQSCPTLCDPMNRSTPGLPVHHQLPEFIQTHVHQVSDAIQPSHPLSSPSPPASNPSQHQSFPMSQFFTSGGQKYWSFSFRISPSNEYSGLIFFRMGTEVLPNQTWAHVQ